MDLADAGADMALLAVATFVALLFEDVEHQQQAYVVTTMILILLSLIVWVMCLKFASIQNALIIGGLWFLDFHVVVSWTLGTMALVLSGVIANRSMRGG